MQVKIPPSGLQKGAVGFLLWHQSLPWVAGASNLAGVAWQRWLFSGGDGAVPASLAWLFWACAALGVLERSSVSRGAEAALLGCFVLAAGEYLSLVGLPASGGQPSAPELRSLLAAGLAHTIGGFPGAALLAMLGVVGWAHTTFRQLAGRAGGWVGGGLVLLIGASTVLGYATGSPWPWAP